MSGRIELPSGLVTFMFTDIESSTRLARMLGSSYGTVLGAHRTVLRAAVAAFGGAELCTEGDSLFIVFGDAAAAVAAAVAAQRALAAHPWPSRDATPQVRMGLHSGWAVPVAGEYASTEVHRAARVAAAAHGGQILCSEATALTATTWSFEPAVAPMGAGGPLADELPPAGTGMSARAAMAGVDLLDLGPHRLRGFDDAERLFQIVAPGLERDFPRPRTPGAAGHNLPAPLSSFVGRRSELGELAGLLSRHRLVTVTGPGGAGKTRLAVATAEELLVAYSEGVWIVDAAPAVAVAGSLTPTAAATALAPAAARQAVPSMRQAGRPVAQAGHAPTAVAQLAHPSPAALSPEDGSPAVTVLARAIATAVGLRMEPGRPILDTVVEHCAHRRMLLILDTCDAAPAAVVAVARRLLAACPELDVLATSREPLGVHGEVVWRLPPLLPADAFALLDERSMAARGGRCATLEESADLARVVSRLDGSPLAIELAAARLRLLSGGQLASRLDDPLAALDGGTPTASACLDPDSRHNSLTGTLDWSYRTLGERAAGLLRRLAVFAGPVELSAVEWCGVDAVGALAELTDKSLVDVLPGPRYRLSRQVRGYATRRLAAAGDEQAARDRHVAWSLHVLERVAVDTDGQPRTVSLTELAPYVAEWQAALRWSATGGSVRAGLRLAGALEPWWREHGGARDGRDLLFRLYGRLDGDRIAPADLASAYLLHAGLADDREERARFLDRAEDIARQVDHPALLVRALAGRRITLLEQSRLADAEQVCRDAVALAERTGVPAAALPAVVALTELLWRRGELDEAAEFLGGARLIEAGRPEDRGRRTVDWLLGMVALCRGDLVAAHDHLVVALRSRLRYGFRGAAADAVAAIAVRCALGGDAATAAVLFGGSESVRGARRTELFRPFWSQQQARVRSALGDLAFDAAYADGADRGFDRIVATALAVEHPDLEQGSARFARTLS